MKSSFRSRLLAATPSLCLAACQSPLSAKIERASLERACTDGTWVGRDPVDGTLVAVKTDGFGYAVADVSDGVTADEVCKARQ